MREHEKLERRIQDVQSQLDSFPKGELICTKNGKNYKWYIKGGGNLTYIPKKNEQLAEQLALKKYMTVKLRESEEEKKALELYLNKHMRIRKAEELLKEESRYHHLLKKHFTSLSQELDEWMNLSYKQNENYPEQLLHKSLSGHLVRSKSEALIDMYLYINKIPFRYECELQLGDTLLYPDFTVKHPKTGQIYYWEHFGIMDNDSYAQNAFMKLQLYNSNGIIPSVQLITTYETKEHPLSTAVIENVVQNYFL